MGLREILDAMDETAAAEETRLSEAALREAEALLSAAHEDVAAARERYRREAEAEVRAERARLEAEVGLRIATGRGRARDLLVERAFSHAAESLAESRASADYSVCLRLLLAEALAEFPSDQRVLVRCDQRDLPLLANLVPTADGRIELDGSLACCGGIVVQDSNARVVSDNVLERRLERARRVLWPRVASLVLGAGPEGNGDELGGLPAEPRNEPLPDHAVARGGPRPS